MTPVYVYGVPEDRKLEYTGKARHLQIREMLGARSDDCFRVVLVGPQPDPFKLGWWHVTSAWLWLYERNQLYERYVNPTDPTVAAYRVEWEEHLDLSQGMPPTLEAALWRAYYQLTPSFAKDQIQLAVVTDA